MALAAVLTLGACKATGGGQIDDPVPGGVIRSFTGAADFGFNFTCGMKAKNKAVIQGQITYHDTGTSVIGTKTFKPIRLHGVVDPMVFTLPTARRRLRCSWMPPSSRAGIGRSRRRCPRRPAGSPSLSSIRVSRAARKTPLTGDGFSIDLKGGPYPLYTRAGYIESGNIQVDNT